MIKRLSGLTIIDETGGEDVSGEFDLDEAGEFMPIADEIKRRVDEDDGEEYVRRGRRADEPIDSPRQPGDRPGNSKDDKAWNEEQKEKKRQEQIERREERERRQQERKEEREDQPTGERGGGSVEPKQFVCPKCSSNLVDEEGAICPACEMEENPDDFYGFYS